MIHRRMPFPKTWLFSTKNAIGFWKGMNSIVYHTSKEFSKTTQHSYTPIVIWVIHFTVFLYK